MADKNPQTPNKGRAGQVFAIPQRLLTPIGDFLTSQIKRLESRRSSLEKDDPFVSGRSDNFASPDTTAAEQFGHAKTEAIRQELDRRIVQMRKALTRIKLGSYGICESCGKMIDTDRLMVFPETTLCVDCESKKESKRKS
ncbi:MAG: TraR/DksA C4-type zinc finger protein [Candidatus Blackburnbacteria bacterium]|nr:TraR/DksA C4-type zinc finger protein [Candidatus Blackburnbacteria bacterium]